MTLAVATLAVLVMVAAGLVLFHRLAHFLLKDQEPLAERELLLLGILPGLALVGLLVTLLGLVHLFRGWVLLLAAAAIFGLLWRDTKSVIAALCDGMRANAGAARNGKGDHAPPNLPRMPIRPTSSGDLLVRRRAILEHPAARPSAIGGDMQPSGEGAGGWNQLVPVVAPGRSA